MKTVILFALSAACPFLIRRRIELPCTARLFELGSASGQSGQLTEWDRIELDKRNPRCHNQNNSRMG